MTNHSSEGAEMGAAAKTVRVRIAVAVDEHGAWMAYGTDGSEIGDGFDLAVESLEPGEARYVIEAELALPSPVVVTDAKVSAV